VTNKNKNKNFWNQLQFALKGIRSALREERNFKIQFLFGIAAVLLLFFTKADFVWWAVFSVVIAGVLAAELFNSALEQMMDRLHPELHPMIGKAKDFAAAAVLLLSFASLAILAAYLLQLLRL